MLKIYEYNGFMFQYEEGEQPEGATEIKRATPKTRERKAANKSRTVKKGE